MREFGKRAVDALGRVVLPAEVRRLIGLAETDSVRVCVNNKKQIVLVKCEDEEY